MAASVIRHTYLRLQHTNQEKRAASTAQDTTQEPIVRDEAKPETDSSNEQAPHWYSFLTHQVTVAWVLAILTGFTLSAIRWQAKETARSAAEAAKSGELAADTLATNREIERAYIAMSHKDFRIVLGPDNQGGLSPDDPRSLSIVMKIRNYGRTPGDVLGGFFGFSIQRENIGAKPPAVTDGTRMVGGFLLPYPEGFFDFGMQEILGKEKNRQTLRDLVNGNGDFLLWFVGELDYRDRFGKVHKAGYGRRFDHEGRNLIVDSTTTNLNFDRPITTEEAKQYAKS